MSKKILVLAANPQGTSRLRLDQEVRDIEEGLRRSAERDQFELIQTWALRPSDLQRAMLDFEPQIIHFSGHGLVDEGLVLEDESGQPEIVRASALASLFELFPRKIECVILNACYLLPQAEAISQHVPYVIGTKQSISNRASIAFATSFYDALAAGRPFESAYKFGRNAIQLESIDEKLTPVLLQNDAQKESKKAQFRFVLTGDVDDVSQEKLTAIVRHLKDLSGDASLELKKVVSGSIILELEGYEDGYRVLEGYQLKPGKHLRIRVSAGVV